MTLTTDKTTEKSSKDTKKHFKNKKKLENTNKTKNETLKNKKSSLSKETEKAQVKTISDKNFEEQKDDKIMNFTDKVWLEETTKEEEKLLKEISDFIKRNNLHFENSSPVESEQNEYLSISMNESISPKAEEVSSPKTLENYVIHENQTTTSYSEASKQKSCNNDKVRNITNTSGKAQDPKPKPISKMSLKNKQENIKTTKPISSSTETITKKQAPKTKGKVQKKIIDIDMTNSKKLTRNVIIAYKNEKHKNITLKSKQTKDENVSCVEKTENNTKISQNQTNTKKSKPSEIPLSKNRFSKYAKPVSLLAQKQKTDDEDSASTDTHVGRKDITPIEEEIEIKFNENDDIDCQTINLQIQEVLEKTKEDSKEASIKSLENDTKCNKCSRCPNTSLTYETSTPDITDKVTKAKELDLEMVRSSSFTILKVQNNTLSRLESFHQQNISSKNSYYEKNLRPNSSKLKILTPKPSFNSLKGKSSKKNLSTRLSSKGNKPTLKNKVKPNKKDSESIDGPSKTTLSHQLDHITVSEEFEKIQNGSIETVVQKSENDNNLSVEEIKFLKSSSSNKTNVICEYNKHEISPVTSVTSKNTTVNSSKDITKHFKSAPTNKTNSTSTFSSIKTKSITSSDVSQTPNSKKVDSNTWDDPVPKLTALQSQILKTDQKDDENTCKNGTKYSKSAESQSYDNTDKFGCGRFPTTPPPTPEDVFVINDNPAVKDLSLRSFSSNNLKAKPKDKKPGGSMNSKTKIKTKRKKIKDDKLDNKAEVKEPDVTLVDLMVKGKPLKLNELYSTNGAESVPDKVKLEIKIDISPEKDISEGEILGSEEETSSMTSFNWLFTNSDRYDEGLSVNQESVGFSSVCSEDLSRKKDSGDEKSISSNDVSRDFSGEMVHLTQKKSLDLAMAAHKSSSPLKKRVKDKTVVSSKDGKNKIRSDAGDRWLLASTGRFQSTLGITKPTKQDQKMRRTSYRDGKNFADNNDIFDDVQCLQLRRRNSEPYSFKGFVWKHTSPLTTKCHKTSVSSMASSLRHLNTDELEDFFVWETIPLKMTSCWEMSLYHFKKPWSVLSCSIFKDNRRSSTPGQILDTLRRGFNLNQRLPLIYENERTNRSTENLFDVEPSIAQKTIDIRNWLAEAKPSQSQRSDESNGVISEGNFSTDTQIITQNMSNPQVTQKRRKVSKVLKHSEEKLPPKFEHKKATKTSKKWDFSEAEGLKDLIRRKSGGFVTFEQFLISEMEDQDKSRKISSPGQSKSVTNGRKHFDDIRVSESTTSKKDTKESVRIVTPKEEIQPEELVIGVVEEQNTPEEQPPASPKEEKIEQDSGQMTSSQPDRKKFKVFSSDSKIWKYLFIVTLLIAMYYSYVGICNYQS